MVNTDINPAFVFGMFETGLGVSRSLGKNNICVYGFDYKKDIGSYSKYVNFTFCPNPITAKDNFIDFVLQNAKLYKSKPVVFLTADDYLSVFSEYRNIFSEYLFLNIPNEETVSLALNKTNLYSKLLNLNISCPRTFYSINECTFPVLIKASNVNDWRNKISGNSKVIIANNIEELKNSINKLNDLNVGFVLQEIIPGNDDKFYKYSGYRTAEGEIIAEFMLQKLRQNPIRFGVGSLVKSVYIEELKNMGRKVMEMLNYNGIGSIEFKYDIRDNTYKFIEINTRYWQQNSLPDKCGINFPLIDYNYLVNKKIKFKKDRYRTGLKWVNLYMDFSSFMEYRIEGKMKLSDWLDDLKGEKVFSDFSSDDIVPGFYEIILSGKAKKIPKYLKSIFN